MEKSLPIGVTEFEEIQSNNYYMVDKTLMIEEFLTRKSKVTLITRPRRFGKTSNMSMMAEFFDKTRYSKNLFQNTNISKTVFYKEMNQYPTIFLSFANCKGDFGAMKKVLFETIRAEYAKHRKQFEQDNYDLDLKDQVMNNYKALCAGRDLVSINTSIKTLSQFLYTTYSKRVMVFIDEYDTPFIEAHIGGYYNEIKNDLSLMLQSALKDNNCIKYAMLTGIQRVAKESIFSHLNNIKVFTIKDKGYASYFGFTTEETKTLLEYYGLKLSDDVKEMYDGYNMGGIEIYNPWSIINYAEQKELIPYWVNTSSNTMIKDAMKQSSQDFKEGYETLIKKGYLDTQIRMETSFYEEITTGSLWGLFVNAGYLKIDRAINSTSGIFRLSIPNQEVVLEFQSLTASYLSISEESMNMMLYYLMHKDAKAFFKVYRSILLELPSYHDLKGENSYHMMMLGMCVALCKDYVILSNREVGLGRCDTIPLRYIVLKAKEKRHPSFVLEFKYTKEHMDLKQLASQAIEQIKERKYDYELRGECIYIGLAHYGKEAEMIWELYTL